MHIKKLEISGFKSFVDRTVIHFDHDVIGIVGPNGCGKSNIVDAIRWCMGEQSAKHLRGRAMSDVIFAGSQSRGPHGMAEVTITFDNSDREAAQTLPLEYRDWSDIAVTRRLYRDGTSEYLVNKTQVRLKDITDLFLGTGVGTKAYSIIEQGKIGMIVSARAEDRRLLIEEAAGITKYKARRKQAEQKMDQTRQNLLRVGDIVSEIERSLASLKRQAAKAERYVSYRKELDELVLHEASHKLLELTVRAQVDLNALESATEQEQQSRAALDAREAGLEAQRQAAHSAEERAEAAHTASFRADNDVRMHEAELERAREKMLELDERRRAALAEEQELRAKLEELAAERESLVEVLEAAEDEESRGEEATRVELEQLDELRVAQQEAERSASELKRQAAEAQAAVAGAEATLAGHARRVGEMAQREGRLREEDDRLGLEVEDIETRRAALAEQIDELRSGKLTSAERRDELDVSLKELREKAVGLDRSVDTAKNELSQKRNRLRALEELAARHEGVGQGPKALMATNDPCIVGLVADRFEAPKELTAAFAGVLGEKLEWVVVDDMERGRALLADLAAKNKGRATLVPSSPRYVAGRAASVPSFEPELAARVGGRLVDRIDYLPSDAALAESLFGDVLVGDDDETASAVLAAGWYGRVVTLSGTVHGADGSLTGGAGDKVAAGMLEQKREMRELHEAVAERDTVVSALLAEQQETRLRLTETSVALDRARNEAHQGELALVTVEKDLRRAEEQLASVQRRLVTVRTEIAELSDKLAAAAKEQTDAETVLEEGRAKKEACAERAVEADEVASTWRDQVTRQQSVVTERKISLAQLKERATSVRQTVERLGKSVDEMRARSERLEGEQIECALLAGQAAARMLHHRTELVVSIAIARDAAMELAEARDALEGLRAELSSVELDLRELRRAVEAATERLRTHQTNLATLEIQRQHLLDGVRERFRGLELPTVVGDYHKRPPVDEAHRARITELGELLERMGPVNLEAVREHAEAEERFGYYSTQKADLEQALSDLEQAILQMNRETKRLFREAYDAINARFKVLFPKMFRGGQAELRLTNPDDLLETGIEILAQPPGKKLSSIELMSGGEKALTAVSLIFAIFQFKPSPFCILDEVDAPLDEANVTRYNEAIRSMTASSQFILITHIKRTMQSVDVLYGVTMQEPGVSKLVSVKINETAEARSRTKAASAEEATQSTEAAAVA